MCSCVCDRGFCNLERVLFDAYVINFFSINTLDLFLASARVIKTCIEEGTHHRTYTSSIVLIIDIYMSSQTDKGIVFTWLIMEQKLMIVRL